MSESGIPPQKAHERRIKMDRIFIPRSLLDLDVVVCILLAPFFAILLDSWGIISRFFSFYSYLFMCFIRQYLTTTSSRESEIPYFSAVVCEKELRDKKRINTSIFPLFIHFYPSSHLTRQVSVSSYVVLLSKCFYQKCRGNIRKISVESDEIYISV